MPYKLNPALVLQTLLEFEQSTDIIDLNYSGSSQVNSNYIGRIAAVLSSRLTLDRSSLRQSYLECIRRPDLRRRNIYRVGDEQPAGISWEHSSLMTALADMGIFIERYPIAYSSEIGMLCFTGDRGISERRRSGFVFAVALMLLEGNTR